jgi:hypothetical protein
MGSIAKVARAKRGLAKALRASDSDSWAAAFTEAASLLEVSGEVVDAAECFADLASALSPSDVAARIKALNERARILRDAKHPTAETAAHDVVKLHAEVGGHHVPDGVNFETVVRSALAKGDAKTAYQTAWSAVRVHGNRLECFEVLLKAAGDDMPPSESGSRCVCVYVCACIYV